MAPNPEPPPAHSRPRAPEVSPGGNDRQAEQDFRAALHEIHSNVGVRRLMFVVANVLVPTMLMAATDAMSGTSYPDALRWVPEYILPLVGAVLAVAGILITMVLSRCHLGMVVNGTKLAVAEDGSFQPMPLNWLGVTTNFVWLTAASAGLGTAVLAGALGTPVWVVALAALLVVVLLMGMLGLQHRRANGICRTLKGNWQHGDLPPVLKERHATESLDDTTNDIAVVVTMAVALFAGAFNAMTNIGGIPADLDVGIPTQEIQAHGLTVLGGYLTLSLLLSCRMVVRLRIALAQHATKLAALRSEPDAPWCFSPTERTFLLYLIVLTLGIASTVITLWSAFPPTDGPTLAYGTGTAVLVAGLLWYPLALRRARPGGS